MTTTVPEAAPWEIDALQKQFTQLGLGELWGIIFGYITDGTDTYDDIVNRMQYDPAAQTVLKKRFPALESRSASAHPLSIKDYFALEDQYRQIIQSAGLPKGFYDQNSDYTSWIQNDVSPYEVQSRVSTAATAASNADPYVKQALRDFYGVDDSGILAHFLDPKVAKDVLETQYGAAVTGGAYQSQGLSINRDLAEQVGSRIGPNGGREAANAAGAIAADLPRAADLSNIYGDNLTSEDMTRDTFDLSGGAAARKKKGRLASQERAAFTGSSGAQNGSFSTATAGMI